MHISRYPGSINKIAAILLLAVTATFCGTSDSTADSARGRTPFPFEFHGFAGYNFGQLVRANDGLTIDPMATEETTPELTKRWITRLELWLDMELQFSERIKAFGSFGGMIFYNYYSTINRTVDKIKWAKRGFFGVTRAWLQWDALGDPQSPMLRVDVGRFPFKYAPESKNLGEYLFTSGLYPGLLFSLQPLSNMNTPELLGIRLNSTLLDGLITQDLIWSSETEVWPMFDFSLTYIPGIHLLNAIDFSAGISFWRLVPVDERLTTPALDKSRFIPGQYSGDDSLYVHIEGTDTVYYTFKGIKAMGRLCLDPKRFFVREGDVWLLGEEDLKIYGEIAVLGLEDYAPYYTEITERMPMMAGFNVPCFKLLDYLSVEIERYTMPYANYTEPIYRAQTTVPFQVDPFLGDSIKAEVEEIFKEEDNIKWSITAQRSIGDHIRILGRAASDHTRLLDHEGAPVYRPNFENPKHWYYVFLLAYHF